MQARLAEWLPVVLSYLGTYLWHSTVLLAGAWLVDRWLQPRSDFIRERMWKAAALAGFATAGFQLSWASARPLLAIPLYTAAGGTAAVKVDVGPGPIAVTENASDRQVPAADSALAPAEQVNSGTTDDRLASATAAASDVGASSLPITSGAVVPLPPLPEDRPAKLHGKALTERATPTGSNRTPREADRVSPSDAPAPSAAGIRNRHHTRWTAQWVLEMAMLVFVGIALVRLTWQSWTLRRALQQSQPVSNQAVQRTMAQLLRAAGTRRPVILLTSAYCHEPVALGVIRWRIVLPGGMDRELSRNELRALLAHELAHLVRGDGFWLGMGRVLCTCFAFQPFNFIARQRWQAAAELQCDDWAARLTSDPIALARCLTRVMEWKLNRSVPALALPAAGWRRPPLSVRVERLLSEPFQPDHWRTASHRLLSAAIGLSVAAAVAHWAPQTPLAPHVLEAAQPDRTSRLAEPRVREAGTHAGDGASETISSLRPERNDRQLTSGGEQFFADDAPLFDPGKGKRSSGGSGSGEPLVGKDSRERPRPRITNDKRPTDTDNSLEDVLRRTDQEITQLQRELEGLSSRLGKWSRERNTQELHRRLLQKARELEHRWQELARTARELAAERCELEQSSVE